MELLDKVNKKCFKILCLWIRTLSFFQKKFEWKKIDDKYEAVIVAARYARYLFERSKEQNFKLPSKPIFIAMDAYLNKKVEYKK